MSQGESGQREFGSEGKPRALVVDDEADIRLMLDLFSETPALTFPLLLRLQLPWKWRNVRR